MPASPALAPGAGLGGLARASPRPRSPRSPFLPSLAADREFTVSATGPRPGRAARDRFERRDFDPATLHPCGRSSRCATRRCCTSRAGNAERRAHTVDATTGDVDLYVYRHDASGSSARSSPSPPAPDRAERVHVPAASGSYLVRAVSFGIGTTAVSARARLAPRPAAMPDVDHPRGRQEELVSDPARCGLAARGGSARATATCSSRPIAYSRTTRTRAGSRPRSRSTAAGTGKRSVPSRARRGPIRRSASTPTATRCWSPTRPGSVVVRRWTRLGAA